MQPSQRVVTATASAISSRVFASRWFVLAPAPPRGRPFKVSGVRCASSWNRALRVQWSVSNRSSKMTPIGFIAFPARGPWVNRGGCPGIAGTQAPRRLNDKSLNAREPMGPAQTHRLWISLCATLSCAIRSGKLNPSTPTRGERDCVRRKETPRLNIASRATPICIRTPLRKLVPLPALPAQTFGTESA